MCGAVMVALFEISGSDSYPKWFTTYIFELLIYPDLVSIFNSRTIATRFVISGDGYTR